MNIRVVAMSTYALRLWPLLACLAIALTASSQSSTGGVFSQEAKPIWGSTGPSVILSPDKTKSVVLAKPADPDSEGGGYKVTVKAFGREFRTRIGPMVNSEAAWAPDSSAFFVTYSDGGNVGTYHVNVYYVRPSGLKIVEPIRGGRQLFAPHCFSPETPNIGAVKWISSSRLLIALEVPPHGSCAAMGTFRAFEIQLPQGTVLRSHSQVETKRLFAKSLGVELQNANDDSSRNPNKCRPPGLKAIVQKQHR